MQWNKIGTKAIDFVPLLVFPWNKNARLSESFLPNLILLSDEYEGRMAVAQYDDHQDQVQAQCIAYQDAFIGVLSTLPYGDSHGGDWHWEGLELPKNGLIGKEPSS